MITVEDMITRAAGIGPDGHPLTKRSGSQNEYFPSEDEDEQTAVETSPLILPPWTDAAEFCAAPCPPPPEIIRGILHQGSKMVYGGPSKARKSWVLLDQGFSVATGSSWLGFTTTAAPVVFVNFELPEFAIHHRLNVIATAKGVAIPTDGQFVIWNLRGHAAPFDTLLPALTARIKERRFGLVILDPSYKLLGQADENSARDMAQVLNAIERLAVETGAAVAFSAHFAKGNAAGKESIDRISGSGVFARDPDSILTASALETPDAYAIEPILRNLPPHPPFAVRWEYPLMRVAEDLDPAALKKPQGRAAKLKPKPDDVIALFRDRPDKPRAGLMTSVELRAAFRAQGWEDSAAPAMRDTLEGEGRLKVWRGPHNQKLCGLPSVVDAYERQQAEAGTVLEQPALPTTKTTHKRKRQ